MCERAGWQDYGYLGHVLFVFGVVGVFGRAEGVGGVFWGWWAVGAVVLGFYIHTSSVVVIVGK